MGTGLKRIKEICKKENAPYPKVEYNENYFYMDFRQSKEYLELAEEKTVNVITQKTTQKTTQKILEILEKNPSITRKQLSSLIGITEDGIKYNLKKLQNAGLIKRIGPDKGGYWEVKKD